MTNSSYKISIITPSYNQGSFLEKTIKSVLDQNYSNFEYIIIDGGSTDGTVDIIKKYEDKIDFWVSEKDGGQSDAINKGLKKASGDILTWLNSDDYLLPGALSHIGNSEFWKDPNVGAVVGIGHKVDLDGVIKYTPKYRGEINTDSLYSWTDGKNFMQPACFYRKEAWEICGPLKEELYFCMDVDLWIEISKKYKFKRIDISLAHAHIHESAKTTAEVEKMKLETYLMIASQGGFVSARNNLFNFYSKQLVNFNSRSSSFLHKVSNILRWKK